MTQFVIAIATLFLLTQGLGMYADKMRSDLYAQYRDLKRMPPDSKPVKALHFWSNVSWASWRARVPLLLGTLLCAAASLFNALR